MGSLSSIVPVVSSIGSPALGTVTQLASAVGAFDQSDAKRRREEQIAQQKLALALAQLQQNQAAQLSNLETQIGLDRQKLEADSQAAEEQRLSALRRAMARQKTQFASQGLSSGGSGSSEAVLLGLFEESEDERQERARLDEIRNRALDHEFSAQKSLNVLQRSQLKERQRLQRALSDY